MGTSCSGNLVLCPAPISIPPAQFSIPPAQSEGKKTYTRLQPIHACKRARDADTPADISAPPDDCPLHHQIHRLASRGPTRRECSITGIVRSAEYIVLCLAPHDALRQIGLCDHDGAETLENLHQCRGDELRCVVDVADIADGRVDACDVELVFERHGETVQRATLGRREGIEFGGAGESAGEEGFGEGVCLGVLVSRLFLYYGGGARTSWWIIAALSGTVSLNSE